EVRREWQTSVANQDPWTVFRNSETWRPNPSIDEGHYTTIALGGVLDARNDPEEPTSGWLIRTSFEDSRSTDVVPNTGVPAGLRDAIPPGSYRFDRIFVDVRHYARISPGGRVNVLPADRMPSFSSWLVDAGLGVDWGGFGVYIAKAVTTGERLHLTVRLDHRF